MLCILYIIYLENTINIPYLTKCKLRYLLSICSSNSIIHIVLLWFYLYSYINFIINLEFKLIIMYKIIHHFVFSSQFFKKIRKVTFFNFCNPIKICRCIDITLFTLFLMFCENKLLYLNYSLLIYYILAMD